MFAPFPQCGDTSGASLGVRSVALLHALLSVVSRLSLGGMRQGIREVKETAILINSIFEDREFLGSSLVRPWFVLGLLPERNREGTTGRNLKKSAFFAQAQVVSLSEGMSPKGEVVAA